MEGRLNKFAGERALLEQDYIKDPKKTIGQHIKETISTIGKLPQQAEKDIMAVSFSIFVCCIMNQVKDFEPGYVEVKL